MNKKCVNVFILFHFVFPKRNVKFIILSFSAGYIKLCKKNDPNLSSCWANTFQSLVPYLVKGIPELDLPPIEPLIIPGLEINPTLFGQTPLMLNVKNLTFNGIRDLSVKDVNVDLDKLVFKFKIFIPLFTLNATYNIKGDLGVAVLDSSGLAEGIYGKNDNLYYINKYLISV